MKTFARRSSRGTRSTCRGSAGILDPLDCRLGRCSSSGRRSPGRSTPMDGSQFAGLCSRADPSLSLCPGRWASAIPFGGTTRGRPCQMARRSTGNGYMCKTKTGRRRGGVAADLFSTRRGGNRRYCSHGWTWNGSWRRRCGERSGSDAPASIFGEKAIFSTC